jgi:hypothetical protein
MKRLVTSLAIAIALLISGLVITQSPLVGTAYAEDGGAD